MSGQISASSAALLELTVMLFMRWRWASQAEEERKVGDSVETIVRFYLHLLKDDTGRKRATAFDKLAVAAGF